MFYVAEHRIGLGWMRVNDNLYSTAQEAQTAAEKTIAPNNGFLNIKEEVKEKQPIQQITVGLEEYEDTIYPFFFMSMDCSTYWPLPLCRGQYF